MERKAAFMTERTRSLTVELLNAEGCSCIIRNGDRMRIFRRRGVIDLYELLAHEPLFLDGAYIADKVVGKAAAALMVLGGVAELHTGIISRPALDLLEKAGTAVEYGLCVPHIINRTQTDMCPLEKLCGQCATAEECLAPISDFMEKANR